MKGSLITACVLMIGALILVGAGQHVSNGFGITVLGAVFALLSIVLAFEAGEKLAIPKVTSRDVVKILAQWNEAGSLMATVGFLNGKTTKAKCQNELGVGDYAQCDASGKLVRFPVERSA